MQGFPVAILPIGTEDQMMAGLQQIMAQYSGVAAFIHVHPAFEGFISSEERQIVKQVFLMVKHLRKALIPNARFVIATQMDGQLGMSGTPCGAVGGGLIGLLKTARQEWETVYCRAVDLDPLFSQSEAIDALLSEFFDPNRRIAEVGRNAAGRVTLVGVGV